MHGFVENESHHQCRVTTSIIFCPFNHENFINSASMCKTSQNISVVIPFNDSKEALRKALHSLLYQTLKPTEIIVVNSTQSDDLEEVINEYKRRLIVNISAFMRKSSKNARYVSKK